MIPHAYITYCIYYIVYTNNTYNNLSHKIYYETMIYENRRQLIKFIDLK